MSPAESLSTHKEKKKTCVLNVWTDLSLVHDTMRFILSAPVEHNFYVAWFLLPHVLYTSLRSCPMRAERSGWQEIPGSTVVSCSELVLTQTPRATRKIWVNRTSIYDRYFLRLKNLSGFENPLLCRIQLSLVWADESLLYAYNALQVSKNTVKRALESSYHISRPPWLYVTRPVNDYRNLIVISSYMQASVYLI